jgi:hypothetical protein
MHDCSYDFSDEETSALRNSHSMGNIQKFSPYSENQQAWDLPTLLDYEKEKVI